MPRLERDHYRVLAVGPEATIEEIERSFRQLARRLHPDLNGGDGAAEERMKELNVARETLTDPAARAAYDERLRRERAASAARPPAAAPPGARRPPSSSRPFVPWTGEKEEARTPASRSDLDPWAPVGRVFWLAFFSLLGLGAVVGVIWIRRSLGL